MPGQTNRHISWASKILAFARPTQAVYVWDRNVREILERAGGVGIVGADANAYRIFHGCMTLQLNDALGNKVFAAALDQLEKAVEALPDTEQHQPLAAAAFRPHLRSFLARRLLDKLMWCAADREQREARTAPTDVTPAPDRQRREARRAAATQAVLQTEIRHAASAAHRQDTARADERCAVSDEVERALRDYLRGRAVDGAIWGAPTDEGNAADRPTAGPVAGPGAARHPPTEADGPYRIEIHRAPGNLRVSVRLWRRDAIACAAGINPPPAGYGLYANPRSPRQVRYTSDSPQVLAWIQSHLDAAGGMSVGPVCPHRTIPGVYGASVTFGRTQDAATPRIAFGKAVINAMRAYAVAAGIGQP